MRAVFSILLLGIIGVFALPAAAQTRDHAVLMHFDKAVAVPGKILSPGTYTFLAPEIARGAFIQIFNERRTELIATVPVLDASRLEAANAFEVTLGDREDTAEPALVRWFEAGATHGYELLYSYKKGQRRGAHETTISAGPIQRTLAAD